MKEFFKALKNSNWVDEHMLLDQAQEFENYVMRRLSGIEGRLCALERGNPTPKREKDAGDSGQGE